MATKKKKPASEMTVDEVRLFAVKAQLDPRTAKRALLGEQLHTLRSRENVARVAEEMGIVIPARPRRAS